MRMGRRKSKEWCGHLLRMRRLLARYLAIGAVLAIALLGLLGCGDPTAELLEGTATRVASRGEAPLAYEAVLCVHEARIKVLVADTPEERAAGLSGYAGLPEDAGMLFVYAEPQQPSFWMKGMEISLDIIWLRDSVVVQIHADVPPAAGDTPEAYLPRYRPDEPVTHVLELNAGAAERLGIVVGSRIEPCPDATPKA